MQAQTPIPRLTDISFRFFGIFSILFFTAICIYNWKGPTAETWATQRIKGGDLVQHYVAGQLWQQGHVTDIYRNFKLGEAMNQWLIVHGAKKDAVVQNFNGVYNPLVVLLASWLCVLPFYYWIIGWLILLIGGFLLSLFILSRTVFRQQPFSIILLALGLATFYYTIMLSQYSTVTLFIFCVAGWCMKKEKHALAGFVVSCAFYKPQLMPYIGLFLILCRNWKAGLSVLLGTTFWQVLSIVACGWDAYAMWLESLKNVASGVQFIKQGTDISWVHFFQVFFPSRTIASALGQMTGLTLFVIAAWAVCKGKALRESPTTLWLALSTWIFASPYVGYYELLLGLPWWLYFIQRSKWGNIDTLLIILFWLLNFFAIWGTLGTPRSLDIVAPIYAIWFLSSLARSLMLDNARWSDS